MDIYVVILRLVHIIAGVLWVGSGFFSTFVMLPTLVNYGPDVSKLTSRLAQNRAFAMIFPVTAGLTMLAGILLYIRPGASGSFTGLGWGVLSIGALCGIAAGVHGGAVLGRATGEFVAKSNANAPVAELTSLGAKLIQHAYISLALAVIAVVGMAIARYL